MLLLYFLILITDLFLIFYGNLSFWIGFPVFLFSMFTIFIHFYRFLKTNYKINQLKRKTKAKWLGELSLISGFDLVPNQDIFLALTRRDNLVFIAEQNEIIVKLNDVEGILITKGQNLQNASDDYLKKLLNRNSATKDFDYIRSLISKNKYYQKRTIVIFSLENKDNKNIRWSRDLVMLLINQGNKNFQQFLKRPEVRKKVGFLNKSDKLKTSHRVEREI